MKKSLETLIDAKDKYEGTVECCKLKTESKCLGCAKPIQLSASPIVKCIHCNFKQKIANCIQSKTMQLQIKSQNAVIKKFVVFSNALLAFITQNELNNKTDSEIEDFVLMTDNIKVECEPSSDIATSLCLF